MIYKNILITGSSTGIGEELALRYGEKAENLYLIARSCEKLEALKNKIAEDNLQVKIYIHCLDLSDLEATSELSKKFAEKSVLFDLIIFNAGMSLGHKETKFTSSNEFNHLFKVNFLSINALLEHLIPEIQKPKNQNIKKKIVFISSLASIITMPSSIAYSTSKKAINGYAEGLTYLLLQNNVRIVNILPGFIKTPLTDKNSFKMPFLLELQNGVDKIENAIEKGRSFTAFPIQFFSLIWLIKLIPISLRKYILLKLFNPKKENNS